jgi:hypothetical protein
VWPRGRRIGISIAVPGSVYIAVPGRARQAGTFVGAVCTGLGPRTSIAGSKHYLL